MSKNRATKHMSPRDAKKHKLATQVHVRESYGSPFGIPANNDVRHELMLMECEDTVKLWNQRRQDFIAIAIPKTASTAISQVQIITHGAKWNKTRQPGFTLGTRTHASLSEYRQVMPEDQFQQMFKFGFVRNPWDRAVSLYFNRERLHNLSTFPAFIQNHVAASDCAILPTYKRSQLDWFKDPETGEVLADFIGKFENLRDDLDYCLNIIRERYLQTYGSLEDFKTDAIDTLKMHPSTESHLHKEIASKTEFYRDYYDDTTRDIIRERFAEDIEYFGYEF